MDLKRFDQKGCSSKKEEGVTEAVHGRLNKDPAYRAADGGEAQGHAEKVAVNLQFVAGLVEELKSTGCKVVQWSKCWPRKRTIKLAVPSPAAQFDDDRDIRDQENDRFLAGKPWRTGSWSRLRSRIEKNDR